LFDLQGLASGGDNRVTPFLKLKIMAKKKTHGGKRNQQGENLLMIRK